MKNALWIFEKSPPDRHVAFRAAFELPADGEVEIHTVGSSWYRAWLDGEWLLEGPLRFAPVRPEYDTHRVAVSRGRHVLAFHAHHIGAGTRILQNLAPFLWCRMMRDGKEVPLDWRATALPGYHPGIRRINPQLGWIENCFTAENPRDWQQPDFDDAAWDIPECGDSPLPEPQPAELANLLRLEAPVRQIAGGALASALGYADDDPPAVFFLRDRNPAALPATGAWWRYDLGRVRLGSPEIVVEAPEGTVMEIALAEQLTEGRVAPWIPLSLGQSCNLDRHVLSGGRQVIAPLTPKGGRFLEIHLVHSTQARLLDVRFHERAYHHPTEAVFQCGDPSLERIWATGVETYRACAEDAAIDNPTRERGQWINDVTAVHMAIASVSYHDLRLSRRALVQAALCSREDGLVAGLCPGEPGYLPTIALQWTIAVQNYYRLTGDIRLLEELYPAACRNLEVFAGAATEDGLQTVEGWNFIDWGYECEKPADPAANLYYLWALRSMSEWSRTVGRDGDPARALAARVEIALARMIHDRKDLATLGYHATVLAARLGLLPPQVLPAAREYLRRHMLACFPNADAAPRNDRPFGHNRQLITPYFAHYAFPVLIEAGGMDFILEQYRRCWGWMLQEDRTTWMEVFDTRWSHCHAWAGCPTWQLTRYLSGLHPRQDLSPGACVWKFHPGSLTEATLRLPHPAHRSWIHVRWMRDRDAIRYTLDTPEPLVIHGLPGNDGEVRVCGRFEKVFSPEPGPLRQQMCFSVK